MPTGIVKWYDSEKGFGFITADDGEDVFVHVSTLPEGVPALRPGTKVDFGIVDGRRGKQALSVTILETPSVAKGSRKPADDMAVIIEDVTFPVEQQAAGVHRLIELFEKHGDDEAIIFGHALEDVIDFVPDRPFNDWRYAIDASKIEQALGFVPNETFQTGLAKTIDWYLANEAWWRPLLERAATAR